MVMFTFSVLERKYFLGKFGTKSENGQFILKFSTKTNWNMQNTIVMFNFSVLFGKILSKNSELSV